MVRDIENTAEKTLAISTVVELEGLIPFLESHEKGQPTADVSS
jgi:hypothetical protein